MLNRLKTLVSHEGFRAHPFSMCLRCLVWAFYVAIGRAPAFRLSSHGARIQVPATLRYTSVAGYVLRDWCEPELRHLEMFVRPGHTFIDIGANIGLYTLKAASLTGAAGRVIAVEPGQEASQQLRDNLALNDFPHVTVAQLALSDHAGEATLHHIPLGDDPQAYSLLPDGSTETGETVTIDTLDALVARLGIDTLDVIKMDVEGAEPLVIAGGRATLQRFHPIVIFEVNTRLLAEAAGQRNAAWQALRDLGYQFFRLAGGRLEPADGVGEAFGNLVAIYPSGAADGPATGPEPAREGR